MKTTEQLLSDATVALVRNPTVVLLDATDRLLRLSNGDTTPFEEYEFPNNDRGWSSAIDAAGHEVAELLRGRAA